MTNEPQTERGVWDYNYGPPCAIHSEAITDLRVQQALQNEHIEKVTQQLDRVLKILDNGLKDEVAKLTDILMGVDGEEGYIAQTEELSGLLRDVRKGFRIIGKIIYYGVKGTVVLLPVGAAVWAFSKYVLGVG